MEILSFAFSLENQLTSSFFSSSFKDYVHFTYTVINDCLVCVRSSSAELFCFERSLIYVSMYLCIYVSM